MTNLSITFKKYPEEVPRHDSSIFFLYNGFNGLQEGFAKTEYTWDDDCGSQVTYSEEETEEEKRELIDDGYNLIYSFFPDDGYPTPFNHFLWCYVDDLCEPYIKAYPNEFEEEN